MSKDLGLLDNGRRKLGNVVLQRNNVQRVRKFQINNPRTRGQQAQRMIISTVSNFVAGLKGILDHSAEGVPYGNKSLNFFRKMILKEVRAQAKADSTKPQIQQQAPFLPNNFSFTLPLRNVMVSKGSMVYDYDFLAYSEQDEEGAWKTIAKRGGENLRDITGWNASEILWEFFGLAPGQQLTWLCFILNTQQDPVYNAGWELNTPTANLRNKAIWNARPRIWRIVVKKDIDTSAVVTNNMGPVALASLIGNALDVNKTDIPFFNQLIRDTMRVQIVNQKCNAIFSEVQGIDAGVTNANETCIALATIISDSDGRRTTSRLLPCSFYNEDDDESCKQGLNYTDALASWMIEGVRVGESNKYLNEGL